MALQLILAPMSSSLAQLKGAALKKQELQAHDTGSVCPHCEVFLTAVGTRDSALKS